MNAHVVRTTFVYAALSVLLHSIPARANPKIRTAFFNVYPQAVGTRLDSVPSRAGHCGVCHFNFQSGGDPWNPYGQALRTIGGLGGQSGASNAIAAIRNLDSDGDGYTSQTEITDLGYGNTPTFPGLSAANLSQVLNVNPAEISAHLTPAVSVDNTPPQVTVTAPDGGETLTANRYTNITWTASDASGIAAIHIHESLDGGATFSPVASGLSNSGAYAWIPANRPATNARIRVTAVDGAANTSNDVSDASFTIVSPPGGRVPTTLRDFDMPGTQPFQGGPELSDPQNCAQCHGNYSPAVEPYRNWQGSMMAHASRDPLFEANLVIANQDAPDSGDICLRCHFSRGWLAGRSVPTDGSRMQAGDRIGVSCDLCHRMVDPVFQPGVSPPGDSNILAALTFPGTNYGNGMFVIDPSSIQRGPFTNAAAPHLFTVSPFHRTSAFCGTCHDVSNPAFTRDNGGLYPPNELDAPATNFSPASIGPVERTYSEWVHSSYNSTPGVHAPAFAGNKSDGYVSTCQDCHMRDVAGYGCNTNLNAGVPSRNDLPLHDMTGGSTWLPALLTNLHPAEVNAAAIEAGIARATHILTNAATMSAHDDGGLLKVTVTNECGHKLPTGYPEGRRIWVNVRFFDLTNGVMSESGAYDPDTGVLTRDGAAKIYEVHPGIDTNLTNIVNLAAGPSFHFVLNNRIYEDNRIPPRGFSNATYAAFGGTPVGHHYDDGQYWDDTLYVKPAGAARAEVRLYYQSTSKEFVEFLRDENVTNTRGLEMFNLWNTNGKCPPTLMQQTAISFPTFMIAASAGPGGAISPSGSVTVAQGGNAAFTIEPDPHHHVADVEVDGSSVGPVSSHTFTNVAADHAIAASFAIDRHTLGVVSAHGSPDPAAGLHTNSYGTVLTNAVASPDTWGTTQFVCTGWTMTGNEPAGGATNVMAMTVTNDATLTWNWRTQYWLDTEAGAHGQVDQADQWANDGDDVTITATPDAWHHFAGWSGDTDGCAANGAQITAAMDRARRIAASFAENVTSNGVPETWLARYGLTNAAPSDVELLDSDLDGMPNWQEWHCDTDPTNVLSVLKLLAIRPVPGGAEILWQGGTGVVQFIDVRSDLLSTNAPWVPAFTNPAPTPVTNQFLHDPSTNPLRFYRIRVDR